MGAALIALEHVLVLRLHLSHSNCMPSFKILVAAVLLLQGSLQLFNLLRVWNRKEERKNIYLLKISIVFFFFLVVWLFFFYLCLSTLWRNEEAEEILTQAVIRRYLFPHPTTLTKLEAEQLIHFHAAVPNWCHLPEEPNLIDSFSIMRCHWYIGSVAFSVGRHLHGECISIQNYLCNRENR